jgi:hypothetical protein
MFSRLTGVRTCRAITLSAKPGANPSTVSVIQVGHGFLNVLPCLAARQVKDGCWKNRLAT